MGGAFILKTRMLAQMCKKTMQSQENMGAAPPGCSASRRTFSRLCLVFLHIWASILVFRMLAPPTRMLTPQHPGSILVQSQACPEGALGPQRAHTQWEIGPQGPPKGAQGPWGLKTKGIP